MLKFALATNDLKGAEAVALALHGTCYADAREKWDHLPFRALVVGTTDRPSLLNTEADVGLYVVAERVKKPGTGQVFGLFPMVHHENLSHEESDAHWRDNHAPLALVHHAHMTNYIQLSTVHRISGPEFDGFALCGFDTEADLRERFYTDKESVKVIADDVQKFANVKASPTRLIATPHRYEA